MTERCDVCFGPLPCDLHPAARASPQPTMINPGDTPVSLGAVRAQKQHDNRLWTPVECLRDAIADIENNTTPCDKLLLLRLKVKSKDGGEVFDVGYNCAGLKASEMIALLEVAKATILEEMGYV